MWMWSILLIGSLNSASVFGQHEFHASVAEINVNAENQSLELSLHIFIDDLETALAEAGFDSLYLETQKESPLADSLVNAYIQEHFYIDIADKAIRFSYVGRELSDDLMGLWCYFEATQVDPNFSSLLIHNSLLLKQFDDQRNICRIYKGGDQKHAMFAKGKEDKEIIF